MWSEPSGVRAISGVAKLLRTESSFVHPAAAALPVTASAVPVVASTDATARNRLSIMPTPKVVLKRPRCASCRLVGRHATGADRQLTRAPLEEPSGSCHNLSQSDLDLVPEE